MYFFIIYLFILQNETQHHNITELEKTEDPDNFYYLPKIASNFEYTLVLDLDETLIHFFYVSIK